MLLYRSYPVVKVVASIVPDKRELAQTDNQVRVTVCVKLQPNLENSNTATKLHLKLHLDTQFGRAVFQTDKLNKREWDIQASEVQHCEEFELSIRPKLEFIFRPLELELHYENLNGPSASSPGESVSQAIGGCFAVLCCVHMEKSMTKALLLRITFRFLRKLCSGEDGARVCQHQTVLHEWLCDREMRR